MKLLLSKIVLGFTLFTILMAPALARAQFKDGDNVFSKNFSLAVCDGPDLPPALKKTLPTGDDFVKKYGHQPPYEVCDFRTFMVQIQHLINIMLIFGVLAAIVSFTIAGGLYISGTPKNITRARSIFPKVLGGFALMLTGWFIVYQILAWLTGSTYGNFLKP